MHVRTFFYPFTITFFLIFLTVTHLFSQKEFNIPDKQNITVTLPTKKINAGISMRSTAGRSAAASRTYYWYDNVAIHETKGGYAGHLLSGEYNEFFYPGNDLAVSGKFRSGLKTGKWVCWDENRQIKERSYWKNGCLHGRRYSYNVHGNLMSVEIYKHGLLNGKKVVFISDTLKKTTYYKNGRIKSRRNFLSKKQSSGDTVAKVSNTPATASSKTSDSSKKKQSTTANNPKGNKASVSNDGKNNTETTKKKKGLWTRVKSIFRSHREQ